MRRLLALCLALAIGIAGMFAYDYLKIARPPVADAGPPLASAPPPEPPRPAPGPAPSPPVAMLPPAVPAPNPPVLNPPALNLPGPMPSRADRLVIDKTERRLTLYAKGQPFRSYGVALGGNPVGHKQQEGDRRTPEGRYTIDFANKNSAFHLSLRISYPNAADRAAAKARGVPPGSDIMIHGLPNGLGAIGAAHRQRDWTDGCIALTNQEIEEVWRLVAVGTPVEINP